MNLPRIALIALSLALTIPFTSAADAIKSPEIGSDGSVTFRYLDTGAKAVSVSVENFPAPFLMALKDGIWSVTTAPIPPECYYYSLVVDGRYQLDPANPLVERNLYYLNSALIVPSATPQTWDEQETSRGIVHRHRYTTHVAQGYAGNHSEFYVYTPPGYDPAAKEPYPVLYLLHGFSQLDSTWVEQGHADHILDNLLSQGKATPMVVVMPYGYGDQEILKGYKDHVMKNDAVFDRVLVEEIIPQVESAYHVSRRREDRAIAGLSMGGDQSMRIGLAHPELFGSIACMSGASDFVTQGVGRGDYDAARSGLKLLWVGSGTNEEAGLAETHALIGALRARGFSVTGLDAPGMHTWEVWHPDLVDIVPRLFR